jgi:hypothetical protein
VQLNDSPKLTELATAAGTRTKSEALGHQEFVLTYKTYEAAGPACLPIVA